MWTKRLPSGHCTQTVSMERFNNILFIFVVFIVGMEKAKENIFISFAYQKEILRCILYQSCLE